MNSARPSKSQRSTKGSSASSMTRHQARERAVSILYEAKIKAISPLEIVIAEGPNVVDPLTVYLVEGVAAATEDIDEMIARLSSSWEFDRLAVVNVCILELAIFELLDARNNPAVIINEAVELAKTFSEPSSARFVNGVLSSIKNEYLAPNAARDVSPEPPTGAVETQL